MKAEKENRQITYEGAPIKLSVDFSAETFQARTKRNDILKIQKEKNPDNEEFYTQKSCFLEMKEQ